MATQTSLVAQQVRLRQWAEQIRECQNRPEGMDVQTWCTQNWIFLQLEIANPEIWKSEFRYSEIAFFVLDYVSISIGILVKALPHLRCVAAFTNIPIEIIIRYAQKWI